MRSTRRNNLKQFKLQRSLWAIVTGVALLLALLAPVGKLLLPVQVTCGMACCLTSGECCCLTPFEDGHEGEHGVEAVLKQAALSNSCAPNCATSPAVSPTILLKAERANGFSLARTFIPGRQYGSQRRWLLDGLRTAASPRAPPLLFV